MHGAPMGAQRFVFLSHNSVDKLAVEEIARRLRAAGIEPWLDSWHLVPGEKWQPALEKALAEARASVVFVGPSGVGPWQDEEMRVAIDRRVGDPAYRVVPVLLPGARRGKRSAVPPFLANVTWVEFQRSLDEHQSFRRLMAGIEGRPPGDPIEFTGTASNPYQGLQAFDVGNSSLFFGREALTGWLLSDIRSSIGTRGDARVLAIIGASGSGKSSLARAGLLAQLATGAVEGSERWRYVILKPGTDALESLATAGSEALGLSADAKTVLKFQDDLLDDARVLHSQAALAMRGTPPGARLLLLVDQFEEIFTLGTDEDRQRAFIDSLLHSASVADGRIVVVLTLRADFLGRCTAYPPLAAVLSDSQELVGPMSRDELREAIERPAWQSGCEFEPGLVDVLLDDVKAQPGALPLLQHALSELWRKRQGRRLTHDAYERIGGVKGALARRAGEVFQSFSPDEQAVTRRILLRLTQPGEGTEDTRRRAPLAELVPFAEAAPTVELIVRRLADERLLVTEGETVDIAHEALIQGWPTFREWLDQDREALREHRRMTIAAGEWQRLGRDESGLYRGLRLEQALSWRQTNEEVLNALEREFLDASIAARDEKQRESSAKRQRRIASYGVVICLIGVLVGSGMFQYADAERARKGLAKALLAKQAEANRTDLSGALTVFASSYGREAQEKNDRGLFTSLLEKHLFNEYISVSQAIALTQDDLSKVGQRAEVLSSMNAEVFLNPRNEQRRFLALVAGWDHYADPWPRLRGAVADAQSIHDGLVKAGYRSTFLADASLAQLEKGLDELMTEAGKGCVPLRGEPPMRNSRGAVRLVEIKPCENVLVFVYLAGHGFVSLGATYIVPRDAEATTTQPVPSRVMSIEELRGSIAERAAAQIVIADISRSALRVEREITR